MNKSKQERVPCNSSLILFVPFFETLFFRFALISFPIVLSDTSCKEENCRGVCSLI